MVKKRPVHKRADKGRLLGVQRSIGAPTKGGNKGTGPQVCEMKGSKRRSVAKMPSNKEGEGSLSSWEKGAAGKGGEEGQGSESWNPDRWK